MPAVPAGFKVEVFADNLKAPRQIRRAPDGDLFVMEQNAGQITILRGNKDGKPETTSVYATGLTSLNASADAKRLELLKEAMPALRRVALLASRGDPGTSSIVSAARNAARSLGVELEIRSVESVDNIEGTLTAVVKAGGEAVVVAGSPVFFPLQPRIAQWAGAARTPIISPWRELPLAGGLLSYGTSVSAMYRRAAVFVDRILKGEDPATLPVEQPTTFELVVNLKTAKALGLTISPTLLARADEVIE